MNFIPIQQSPVCLLIRYLAFSRKAIALVFVADTFNDCICFQWLQLIYNVLLQNGVYD